MWVHRTTAALLLVTTAGCYSVRRVAQPGDFIETRHPENVWVAAENGEVFRLSGPEVRGDSVVGTVNGTSEQMALDLSGSHEVFARQKDPLKTAGLIAGLGAVAGLAIWGYSEGQGGAKVCPEPGHRGCPQPI